MRFPHRLRHSIGLMLFLALSIVVVDRPIAQACSCVPGDLSSAVWLGDTTEAGVADVAVSDVDDLLDPSGTSTSSGSDSLPTGLIVGLGVVTIVFVFGLNAIRKQRKSGRTSKFPRIG